MFERGLLLHLQKFLQCKAYSEVSDTYNQTGIYCKNVNLALLRNFILFFPFFSNKATEIIRVVLTIKATKRIVMFAYGHLIAIKPLRCNEHGLKWQLATKTKKMSRSQNLQMYTVINGSTSR